MHRILTPNLDSTNLAPDRAAAKLPQMCRKGLTVHRLCFAKCTRHLARLRSYELRCASLSVPAHRHLATRINCETVHNGTDMRVKAVQDSVCRLTRLDLPHPSEPNVQALGTSNNTLVARLSGSIVQPPLNRSDSTRLPHQTEQGAIRSAWAEVSCSKDRKVKKYASPSDSTDSHRRWGAAVAGKSFHPHGTKHQLDLERSRCHWGGFVASQRIWIVPLPLANPRWVTSKQTRFGTRQIESKYRPDS